MKNKVTDYVIASSTSLRGLENAVKEYLSEGWQPQGGVAITIDNGTRLYFQAVVREQGS